MERRLFEDLIESDVVTHKTEPGRRSCPSPIVLHVLMLVSHRHRPPAHARRDLPEPTSVVKAFFVEPGGSPPPPPPPPPPAPKAAVQPKVIPKPVDAESHQFTAPVEVPEEIKPEEGLDLGVEGGVPGGVEGGVPGGVVGGVVGGLPDAPPPVQAVRVGGQIKEPKKLKNVKPRLPGHRQAGPRPGHRDPRVHDQPPGQGHRREGPARHPPARRRPPSTR